MLLHRSPLWRALYDPESEGGTTTAEPAPGSSTQEGSASAQEGGEASSQEGELDPGSPLPYEEDGGESAAEPASSGPSRQIIERARDEFGIDLSKYEDDDQALKGLLEAQRMVGQRDQYAQIGRQLYPYYGQIRQWLGEQQSQPHTEQPGEPQDEGPPKLLDLPEWDESWNRYIGQDESGNVGLVPETPPDVEQKINAYLTKRQQWQQKLTQNPDEAFEPLVQRAVQEAERRITEQWQQRQSVEQRQQTARQIVDGRKDAIFQKNAQGQYVRDPQTGQYAMTPQGQLYVRNVQWLQSQGLQEPQALDQAAWNMAYAQLAANGNQSGNTASPSPSGNGTPAGAAASPNANAGRTPQGTRAVDTQQGVTLRDRLRDALKDVPEEEFEFND